MDQVQASMERVGAKGWLVSRPRATPDALQELAEAIGAFITERPGLFADAAEWFRTIAVRTLASNGDALPPITVRTLDAWRAAMHRFVMRTDGEQTYDLGRTNRERILLTFALLFDPAFDGAAVGLVPMPWKVKDLRPGIPFDGRGYAWGGASPGATGESWDDVRWRLVLRSWASLGANEQRSQPDDFEDLRRIPVASDIRRLHVVQKRVNDLALRYPWFQRAVQAAFVGFSELSRRYVEAGHALQDREWNLARKLVAKGHIVDPRLRDNRPCPFTSVDGLCPAPLAAQAARADRIRQQSRNESNVDVRGRRERRDHSPGNALSRRQQQVLADVERKLAAAALEAMDWHTEYNDRKTTLRRRKAMSARRRTLLASKSHVDYQWVVTTVKPTDWEQPPDPHARDLVPLLPRPRPTGDLMVDVPAIAAWRENVGSAGEDSELARFSDDEYMTIALYRLGGLASSPDVGSTRFPADVAEQMLGRAEAWVRAEQRKRRAASDKRVRKAVREDRPELTPPTEYQPASWFGKVLAARLRMAASKKRKTKRVRNRMVDGVRCYSVEDARRWWPRDLPKDA